MRITFSKTARLSLLVTIILAMSLAFLYLMQRQQIYQNVKETNRAIIEQEAEYYEKLTQRWSDALFTLSKNTDFRFFIDEYSHNKSAALSVYRSQLEKIFGEVGQYRLSHIQYVRFIGSNGKELVVSEYGKPKRKYKNLVTHAFFKQAMSQSLSKSAPVLTKPFFEINKDNAFIHSSLPIINKGKKVGLLSISIDVKELLAKYQHLLSSRVTDHVMLLNKQGKVLYQTKNIQPTKTELSSVLVSIKQSSAKYSIIEDKQNVWSFVYNKPYGFYLLFQSNGQRITTMLNEQYTKVGFVFAVSSFILIMIVFWSTRHIQRKEVQEESKKVMTQQRSIHFASISDEIRPPINALLGSLMTLSETELDKKQHYYANTAKKSAECLLELVNEFQDYSRISRGDFSLEKIEFDLRTTLHDLLALVSSQAYKKGLEISCLVGADVPKRVIGDATRLRQVIINLISFAIKYTQYGEISLCVSVEEGKAIKGGAKGKAKDKNNKQHKTYINIDIIDTGNAVDQETMLAHFKMFTDLKLQNTDHYSSEGLGLALSKQLVELMGGEISVAENNNGGNTFTLRMPMPYATEAGQTKVKINLTGKRVLILGEIETNRTSLSHAFSQWGMSGASMDEFPRIANVLREAKISGKEYDVCIIDVSLTSSSEKAFEAVKEVRNEFSEDDLSIIILTVQGAAGDVRIARDLNVQAFLTKPISRNTMRQTLRQVLDNRRDKTTQIVTRHSLKEGEYKNTSRILAIESDEKTQKNLSRHFSKMGYQVDFAENANKAKAAIIDHTYNLILLDLMIPKMDVFKFTEKFRKDEKALNIAINALDENKMHIPIVGMTNNKNSESVDKCLKSGMNDLVIKPLDENEVQQLVAQYLNEAVSEIIIETEGRNAD